MTGGERMRIVFMGTPEFAVPSLRTLLEDGHTIAAVYTQADKPKGRGHKLCAPPVKELAVEHGIPVFQPKTLRTPEAAEQLRALEPELIVVAAYGKILPPEILQIPASGCINVHASLLPRYRGAGPIQWAIIRGERETGVTIQQMAEGVDTGDILLQESLDIGENETADELYERLSVLGGTVLHRALCALREGTLHACPQREEEATYAPMLSRELSAVDFGLPAGEVHRWILGLSSWPCAEGTLNGMRLKIYRSELVHETGTCGMPGELLPGKDFCIACGDGALRLTEVQGEGSRRMSGADFLRGHPAAPGSRLLRKEL